MPLNFPGGEGAPDLQLALLLVLGGFLVGGAGHVLQMRPLVVIGIVMLMVGGAFPIIAGVTQ